MKTSVQIGVIGAMQRSSPALTQLWLRWTGIPDLERAEFRISRAEEAGPPDTTILLPPKAGIQAGWAALCDTMGLDPDAPERRSMPIRVTASSRGHQNFWQALRRRELTEVDGPLEWWWRLLVLRTRDIRRASKKLSCSVFGDDPFFENCVLAFENPSMEKEGRRIEEVVKSGYSRPARLVIAKSMSSRAKKEGLVFSLDDDKLRGQLTSHLIGLATMRMS